MKKLVLAILVGLGTLSGVLAFTIPEKPAGFVNDYANILQASTKDSLEKELTSFAASTTNEIVVVTVPDIEGGTIETYATTFFDTWKPGSKNNDNGILFIIAPNDHVARIEVGYGLEGALTDALSAKILSDEVFPEFKNGSYDLGILKGVLAIAKATQGEYVVANKKPAVRETLVTAFMLGLVLVRFFWGMLGMTRSWWLGGVLGGIAGILITVTHAFSITTGGGIVATVILFLFGLLFDYFVSTTSYRGGGTGIGPWFGRGFGGGGTSFGGFGGGRSGGGGASGTW